MSAGSKGAPAAAGLGEFGRIETYLKPLAAGFPGALGLGDDAAVFAVPAGSELVVTTDAMVAGIHFLPDDPPEDIAAKLLRVNLSDLAAMAAAPLCYTLTTALPRAVPESWLAAFAAGLAADQARFDIHLAGGDSVTTPGPTMLSLTCLGLVPAGQALTRRTQGPDDSVWVTGTIGDAALGLLVAQGKLAVEDRDRRHLVERLRRPTPRLDLVPMLRGVAASGLDVSDGLVADLGHICERSGFDAEIDAAALPLSPAARAVLDRHPELLATVLTGGDDYEIVFTVPARREGEVRDATRIGRLTGPGPGRVTVRDAAGQPLDLSASGWKHF